MVKVKKAMAAFDHWGEAFVTHIGKKGVVPGTKEAERSAQTTTNQGRPSNYAPNPLRNHACVYFEDCD
jgi:hypothetical protein